MNRWRVLAVLLPLALGACGFQPLYGAANESAVAQLPDIFVQPIGERSGQELRLALQQRLAGSSDAQPQGFTLAVYPQISQEAVGIHGDNTSGRNRVVGRAHWVLYSVSPAPAVVSQGDARIVDGFNVINEQYFAASIASETTQQRVANNLADTITTQLATWFTSHQAPVTATAHRNPATNLAPSNVPGDSDQSPLRAPGEDGLPASAIGRGSINP
jgi:LPS-assembly lipoprotein